MFLEPDSTFLIVKEFIAKNKTQYASQQNQKSL